MWLKSKNDREWVGRQEDRSVEEPDCKTEIDQKLILSRGAPSAALWEVSRSPINGEPAVC